MKLYRTPRLTLAPTTLNDAQMMLELLNTPKFIQNIGDRGVRTLQDAERYISDRILPHYEKYGYGSFTMILSGNGTKIGTCGLYVRPGLEVPDIGFALFEPYEGQGLAYEAASFLMKKLNEEFTIEKISAITSKTNQASQTLIEKLGLAFKKTVVLPDETEELWYYEN